MSDIVEFSGGDGTKLVYRDSGCGSPLLFIHGWLMSGKVWVRQSPLAGGYRIIAPDLRAHGESSGNEFSYTASADDLAALMDHLDLDRTIVVGWSMGAQIAISSLPKLRERVAALVLVGGTPCFCSRDDYAHGIPHSEARGMALRLRRGFNRTAGEFYRSMFSPEEEGINDIGTIAREIVGKLPSLSVALDALDELVATDLRSSLESVDLPVLLIHGDCDRICLPGASSYMHEHMPDSRMHLFKGAGHAPFLTRSTEFNSLLAEFAGGV